MSSFNFVFRSSTKIGRHPGSLSLRVIHNRRVKTISLSCYIYPEEWDAKNQTVIFPLTDANRIRYLDRVKEKMRLCLESLELRVAALEQEGDYTVEEIIAGYCLSRGEEKLSAWVEVLVIDLMKAKRKRLAEAYQTVTRGLLKYNKSKDICLNQINSFLIKGFEKSLMDQGKKPNTISYYMRNLRSIYNKAVRARRVSAKDEDPFTGVYTKVKATSKRALTAEEMKLLYDINFSELRLNYFMKPTSNGFIEGLYRSWRFFIFCVFAQGMCFIDLAYLRKDNIKDGVCFYYRKKTLQQIEVKVNEGMRCIIESFAEEVKDSPYLFPIIRKNGKDERLQYETALRVQNRRLRILSEIIGVNKKITTHVGRHTFATLARNGGIPMGAISEMLGHTTEKMTQNYLDSFDKSFSDRAYAMIIDAITTKKNMSRSYKLNNKI